MFKRKEPKECSVKGRILHCPICGHVRFWEGKAQLNTALATLFKLDWLNKEIDTRTCEN